METAATFTLRYYASGRHVTTAFCVRHLDHCTSTEGGHVVGVRAQDMESIGRVRWSRTSFDLP